MTLLTLITLWAGVLGFRQTFIVPYIRQEAAAQRIREMKGSLVYSPASPAWLAPIVGREIFHRVTTVRIEHSGIDDGLMNDRLLPALIDMPHVTALYLAGNPVTDRGLRHLTGLEHLQRLSLWRTKITDDGMGSLAGFRKLRVLDLHSTAVTDRGLAQLATLTELRELHLPPRITDTGLAHLSGLPELRVLNAREACWITPRGLRELAHCPIQSFDSGLFDDLRGDELELISGLRRLRSCSPILTVTHCNDAQLRHLAGMHELRELSVSGADLTDAGLVHLESLRNLVVLHVTGRISVAGLDSLRKLPQLKQLRLTTELIGDDDLPALCEGWNGHEVWINTPWLAPPPDFRFSRTAVTRDARQGWDSHLIVELDNDGELHISISPDKSLSGVDGTGRVVRALVTLSVAGRPEDLHRLSRWPELRQLAVFSSASAPMPLDAIVACRKLESLALLDCQLELSELGKLRSLESLSDLTLQLKRHDPSLPDHLRQLDQLQTLKLTLPYATKEFERDVQSSLPGVTVDVKLRRFRSDVQNSGFDAYIWSWWETDFTELATLGPFPNLEVRCFDRHWDLSGLETRDGLQQLKLPGANFGPSVRWECLNGLDSLKLLHLDRSSITDDALRHVGRLSHLIMLELKDTQVSDRGIAHLSGMQNLRILRLARRYQHAGPWITDESLRTIGQLSNLVSLDLQGLDITDEGLKHLAALERLERLDVSNTRITDEGLKVLEAHPSLRHVNIHGTQTTLESDRASGRFQRYTSG